MKLTAVGRRLHTLLGPEERGQARWLLPLMVLKALIETVGVASVLPFIAVVADPQMALENRYLRAVYEAIGFGGMTGFLIFLGTGSLVVLVMSNALSVLVAYLLQKFAMRQRHLLETRLMASSLALPYGAFLDVNTSEIGESILKEVTEVIDGVLSPFLQLIARAVAVAAILCLLVIVNPLLALTTGLALGITYYLVFRIVRLRLKRIGSERHQADRIRYRSVGEAYGGIKDVKAAGREQTFLDSFSRASKRYSALSVMLHVINVVPKAGLEVIAFGGIVLIVLFLIGTGGDTATVLGTVTLYAFACYRLLPAVQQMYEATTQVRFSLPALDVLESHLAGTDPVVARFERPEPLGLGHAIEFADVWFAYPRAESPTLRGVSLTIHRNESVALVGATGSGKTTIVDLVLGLFKPTNGEVLIDGRSLTEDMSRPWRATVGYVPQQVFLTDDSIAANIAFGVPAEDIDRNAVKRAAAVAQIHDFVENLPGGYDTHVGERGVRLSGGQRQRLGIARALYHDPDVVVLDEATSALDSVTENAVFDALAALAGRKTVIIIAHRITTVRSCDVVYLIDRGRVVESGSYEQLLERSAAFRSLAQQPRLLAEA